MEFVRISQSAFDQWMQFIFVHFHRGICKCILVLQFSEIRIQNESSAKNINVTYR